MPIFALGQLCLVRPVELMYVMSSGRPSKCPTRPDSTSKADREVPKEAKDVICLRHLKRLKLLFSLTIVPTSNTFRLHVVFQSD